MTTPPPENGWFLIWRVTSVAGMETVTYAVLDHAEHEAVTRLGTLYELVIDEAQTPEETERLTRLSRKVMSRGSHLSSGEVVAFVMTLDWLAHLLDREADAPVTTDAGRDYVVMRKAHAVSVREIRRTLADGFATVADRRAK